MNNGLDIYKKKQVTFHVYTDTNVLNETLTDASRILYQEKPIYSTFIFSIFYFFNI